jgi:hypothetical protein
MEHIEFLIRRWQRKWLKPWRIKHVSQETVASYEEMMSYLSSLGYNQENLYIVHDLIVGHTRFGGVTAFPIAPNCQ